MLGRTRAMYPGIQSFPGGSDGKVFACNTGDLGLILGWEDPLEKGRIFLPTSAFLLGKSDGQRSLVGYSPWGCKESDMTE